MRSPFKSGFTLVELLVVILILGILASLVVPVLFHVLAVARHGAAEALASNVAQALKTYELDQAIYPPGDGQGSRRMVAALVAPGPKHLPLLDLKDDLVTVDGDLIDPAQASTEAPLGIFHFRNNLGRKPGPDSDGGPGIALRNEVDLWCAGSDYDPRRPASAWSIHRP